MLNFKINDAVIEQVKQTVAYFGVAYVHGCGNFYVNKNDSDTRQNFTNAEQEEATYRVIFNNVNQVPSTVEDFKQALFASKQTEITTPRESKGNERAYLPPVAKVETDEAETTDDTKVVKKGRPSK